MNANYSQVRTGEVLTKTGWTSLPDLPLTRESHCMTYRDNETLMAIGGHEDNTCCSRSVHILDRENQVNVSFLGNPLWLISFWPKIPNNKSGN